MMKHRPELHSPSLIRSDTSTSFPPRLNSDPTSRSAAPLILPRPMSFPSSSFMQAIGPRHSKNPSPSHALWILRLLLRYMTLKYSDCGAVDPAEGCADVATFLCGVNPFTERGPCFDRFDGGGWRNVLRGIVAAEDVDPARTLVTTANGTLDGVSPIPPLSPSMLTSSSTRGCREAPATVLPMLVLPALAPVPARETAPPATTRVGGLNLEGALDLRILCAPTSQTQNLLVLASGGSGVCLCVCSCVCGVDSALHRLGVDQDATIALQSLRDDPRDARRNATVPIGTGVRYPFPTTTAFFNGFG
eukprot:m.153701 g.153701  ORF g.153701 m.153701 type:complete len:304 (-) comp23466_c0_seq3:137-1048(-)